MKRLSKFLIFSGTLIAVCGGSTVAIASNKACLLEGDFTLADERIVINDCAENVVMQAEEFREACEWMGNPFGDDKLKAKITYLQSCPAKPQAECQNVMMGQMNFLYYSRDAEMLATSKTSCDGFGGKWVEGK